jgi:5-methylcytosine-specific restriction endonuclease McrA
MKPCSKCGLRERYHRSWCRECLREYQRANYAANPDRVREIKREAMRRRRADPEKRAWDTEAKRAQWATKYGPAQKERHARRARHFFIARAAVLNRYGRTVTPGDLLLLWWAQRGRCALTGRKLDRRTAQIDHVEARARGGQHLPSNLRWVCREANEARRDLPDADFLRLCREVIATIG